MFPFKITDSIKPLLTLLFICIAVFLTARTQGKATEIYKDFSSIKFLILLGGIILFCIWVFSSKTEDNNKNIKEATRKAIVALIIAYLSHIDMIFTPFFVVFVMDYFLSGWV